MPGTIFPRLFVTAFGLHLALIAQETPVAIRIAADRIRLSSDVDVASASARTGFAKILQSSRQPGGAMIVAGCGEAARSPLHVPAGLSLAAALDILASVHPATYWTFQDGVFNLLPKAVSPSAMGVGIRQFDWDTATDLMQPAITRLFDSMGVMQRIEHLGLHGQLHLDIGLQAAPRIRNGMSEPRQGQKIKVANVSLRDALNAIAASYRNGFWCYEERNCHGERTFQFSAQ